MAILDFLTKNDPVAGLEISDTHLRIVQLRKTKTDVYPELAKPNESKITSKDFKKNKLRKKVVYRTVVTAAAEEPLEAGVISAGKVLNEEKFKQSLVKLQKKAKGISRFVVASIPASLVYLQYFNFPETIGSDKISETMHLTAEFQLPRPAAEYYSDWEKFDLKNSVIMASAAKAEVDKINNTLIKSGYNTVAIEFSNLSISRTFNQDLFTKIFGVIQFNSEDYVISIIENNTPKFQRTLPYKVKSKETWGDEFRKVVDYFESEYQQKIDFLFQVGVGETDKESVSPLGVSEIIGTSKINDDKVRSNDGRWLAALGAAERGALKRSEDKLLSLMSIRTEEAYETKKALAFVGFISSLLIGLSVFMVAVYAGLWFMTISLQRSISNQIRALSAIPVPVGGVELESRAQILNQNILSSAEIIRSLPRWSIVLEKLKNLIPSGIEIKNVNLSDPRGIFSISGIAKDRTQLRVFKKSLDESNFFTNVDMPISNISLKDNIPFSLTMRLIDPDSIYYR